MTVVVDEPCLFRALLARRLFRQHVGQQRDRLDIDALPAIVRNGDDGYAFGGGPLVRRDIEAMSGDPDAWARARRRKAVVSMRHSARDLQVHDAVPKAVSSHALAHYNCERSL